MNQDVVIIIIEGKRTGSLKKHKGNQAGEVQWLLNKGWLKYKNMFNVRLINY